MLYHVTILTYKVTVISLITDGDEEGITASGSWELTSLTNWPARQRLFFLCSLGRLSTDCSETLRLLHHPDWLRSSFIRKSRQKAVKASPEQNCCPGRSSMSQRCRKEPSQVITEPSAQGQTIPAAAVYSTVLQHRGPVWQAQEQFYSIGHKTS